MAPEIYTSWFPTSVRTPSYGRVVVDAAGERVAGGWKPGLFFALAAEEVPDYAGVLPGYKGERPSSTGLASRFAFEAENERLRQRLDTGLLFVAQSQEGRRLLKATKASGYRIVFDRASTQAFSTCALCDYENRLIRLSPDPTVKPALLSLALIQEMKHAEDHGNGLRRDATHTLRSATKIDRALEASGTVADARFVAEVGMDRPDDPPHRFRPPVAELFAQLYPEAAKAAVAAMPHAYTGRWSRFSRTVFRAYYDNEQILADADRALLQNVFGPALSVAGHGASGSEGVLRTLMTRDNASHASIAGIVSSDGVNYLKRARFNLDSDRMSGLMPGAASAYLAFAGRVVKLTSARSERPDFRMPAAPAATPEQPSLMNAWLRPVTRLFAWVHDPGTLSQAPVAPVQDPAVPVIVLPDGLRSGSGLLQAFAEAHAQALHVPGNARRTSTEHLFLAMTGFMQASPGQTAVAASRKLVDAGLRAPIAAFPAEYLSDIASRLQQGVRADTMGRDELFIRSERALFGHWQKLAAAGLDPVDGALKARGQPSRWVPADAAVQAAWLGRIVGKIANKPADKIARIANDDMVTLSYQRTLAAAAPPPVRPLNLRDFSIAPRGFIYWS